VLPVTAQACHREEIPVVRMIVIALVLFAVTACSAEWKGAEVGVKPGSVVVTSGDQQGSFCPPGQAKKGRC
jgi:hypothetical protein